MKHITLFASALILTSGAFAQRTSLAPTQFPLDGTLRTSIKPLESGTTTLGAAKAPGDTIFYEDFANGLTGNTTLGAWTTSGPDGGLWLQDFDGPNGDFSNTGQRIGSTTVLNGFMMFDSNVFNNACNPCITLDGFLISPAMDLSATPNVHLQFEERFRWCCSGDGIHFVDVSIDGGTTWPTRFEVTRNADINVDVQTNEDIGTHLRKFNLTNAIAADPTNVKIRIAHEGSITGNATHYFWQVDDLAIVESPVNDTRLSYTDYDDHIPGDLTANYEYSVYPYSQLRELNMRAYVHNEGTAPATNVTLTVDVSDGASSVFNSTGALASVAPTAADSISIAGFTPPMVAGIYTVDFDLSADDPDASPADNSTSKEFMVDPYIYAMDLGSRDGASHNATNEYMLGNTFYMETATDVTAIEVAIASPSTQLGITSPVGALIHGVLLDANLDPVEFTNEHIISATDVTSVGGANFITLTFPAPVPVNAGEEYVVVMEHFGGATNVRVATSGRSLPFVSLLFDPVNAAGPTWFFTTRTPMVRVSFDPTVGVAQQDELNGVTLSQNYPNPATGITQITYDLEEAANVTLQVTDISGKVVLTLPQGRNPAGKHFVELDTRTLSEGTYFYTLSAGDVQLTKPMSVVR